MMVTIIHTITGELLQTCRTKRTDVLPEELAYIVIDARNLNRADYTIREAEGDYTTNQFHIYMYILDGVAYHKEHQQLFCDKSIISADNADTATLTNCILGGEVYINDILIGVVDTDMTVEVSSAIPTTLTVIVKKDYWLPQEVIINAT